MALGADTLFSLIGLERNLPILACIPFKGQEKIWPKQSKDLYYKILGNPLVTTRVVCEGGYAAWKMQRRNEFMSDECDKAIAIYDGSGGGTQNCIEYLNKIRKDVLRINPKDAR